MKSLETGNDAALADSPQGADLLAQGQRQNQPSTARCAAR